MGIKNFSKLFNNTGSITYTSLKDQLIIIDGMCELYRAALAARSVNTLTDQHGNPTMHIKVIMSVVGKLHKAGAKQIWVFDYDGEEINLMKINELEKRKLLKQKAQDQLNSFKELKIQDDDTSNECSGMNTLTIQQLEKRTFKLSSDMINDIKKLLFQLNIPCISAPNGFEGECIASLLCHHKNKFADGIISTDSDSIVFGSSVLYRRNYRNSNNFDVYSHDDIIEQLERNGINNPTYHDILNICQIMGNDFCEKTPRIGVKTIFKKYSESKKINDVSSLMSAEQIKSKKYFMSHPDIECVLKSVFKCYNVNESSDMTREYFNKLYDKYSFNSDKLIELINWLSDVKSFNKNILINQFQKYL